MECYIIKRKAKYVDRTIKQQKEKYPNIIIKIFVPNNAYVFDNIKKNHNIGKYTEFKRNVVVVSNNSEKYKEDIIDDINIKFDEEAVKKKYDAKW